MLQHILLGSRSSFAQVHLGFRGNRHVWLDFAKAVMRKYQMLAWFRRIFLGPCGTGKLRWGVTAGECGYLFLK